MLFVKCCHCQQMGKHDTSLYTPRIHQWEPGWFIPVQVTEAIKVYTGTQTNNYRCHLSVLRSVQVHLQYTYRYSTTVHGQGLRKKSAALALREVPRSPTENVDFAQFVFDQGEYRRVDALSKPLSL